MARKKSFGKNPKPTKGISWEEIENNSIIPTKQDNETPNNSRREAFYASLGSKHTRVVKTGTKVVSSNKPQK